MDTKNFIKKYKICSAVLIFLFITIAVMAVFLQEEVFTLLFPNSAFRGFSYAVVIVVMFLTTTIYFWCHYLLNKQVSKILQDKCLPLEYKEVYFATSPKTNKIGRLLVTNTCDFMTGNFDSLNIRCLDILQNPKSSQVLVQHAYLSLAQVYFIIEDIDKLTMLRKAVELRKNNSTTEKQQKLFGNIEVFYQNFIDCLNGKTSFMLEAFSNAKNAYKNNSDKYLAMYYYAIALIKSGQIEDAIPILEELVINAGELFVAKFSKLILIQIVAQ